MRPLGPLTVTVLATSMVWWFDLAAYGIKVVGRVECGLPDVSVGRWFPLGDLPDMTVTAGLVTLVRLTPSWKAYPG